MRLEAGGWRVTIDSGQRMRCRGEIGLGRTIGRFNSERPKGKKLGRPPGPHQKAVPPASSLQPESL
jgi:hypothetical protein